MSSSKYLEIARAFYKVIGTGNFQQFASKCRVISASEGRVKVEFDVAQEHTNPMGTLHGGCTAALVDIVTTSALVATPRAAPGVTVDLTVSYLAPAKIGETVIFDASVVKAGKSLAFTRADVSRKSDNVLLAIAQHTKAFPPSK